MKSWNWRRVAVGAIALTLLVFLVVIPITGPIIEFAFADGSEQAVEEMPAAAKVMLRIVKACVALWFFVLGANVGSFLNVVAYRVPRGESVVFRRSHCPKCQTKIKGRDNIPILGWLLLDGRCRTCKTNISCRYPVVELVTAAIFLLLYFVELISGGANIPLRRPNSYHGVVWIILYTKWDLVSLYLFHCFTISTLMAWSLIDIDRQKLPWRAIVVASILFAVPLLSPDVLLVPWLRETNPGPGPPNWLLAMEISFAGGLSGAMLGVVAAQAFRCRKSQGGDTESLTKTFSAPVGHITVAGMVVGMSVGWQATLGVWLMALAIRPVSAAVARSLSFREAPMTAILLVAYLVHLISWRWLTVSWWPSYSTSLIAWVCIGTGFTALWLVNRSLPIIPSAAESYIATNADSSGL
mgnify:CR=1 FL=1